VQFRKILTINDIILTPSKGDSKFMFTAVFVKQESRDIILLE